MITTLAFGMGIDILDILYAIHCGPLNEVLDYWQGIGHCANDGRQGFAFFYLASGRTVKSSTMTDKRNQIKI